MFTLDDDWVEENVLENPKVASAMMDTAERILPIAKRIAYQDGARKFADSLRIESGTRPGTKSPTGIRRPYVRVIAGSEDASAQEYGDVGMPKKRLFARAAAQL